MIACPQGYDAAHIMAQNQNQTNERNGPELEREQNEYDDELNMMTNMNHKSMSIQMKYSEKCDRY